MTLEDAVESPWRKYVADTVAAQSWGLSVGTLLEVGSGWTPEQIVKSRAMMIAMNAVTGRPYGMWRDFVQRKAGITEETNWAAKYLVNGLATASFYTSIYIGLNAIVNDISSEELLKSGVAGFMTGLLSGGPYGYWMNTVRSWMGVKTVYAKQAE